MLLNSQYRLVQLALRAWPFPYGAGRIIDRFFLHLPFRKRLETVRTTDGFFITIDPSDLIGRHIYLRGEFDPSVPRVLCELSKPGDRLLDIGANIGYVSACFLTRIAASSTVAVEPQPNVAQILSTNLGRFGTDRHTIMPFALSDRDGEATFSADPNNSGGGQITEGGQTKVVIREADALFQSGSFAGCTIVKIDVEGHEEQIFAACHRAFAELRPRVIIFEDHGQKAAPSGPIGKRLRSLGYEIYGIKKRLTRLQLVKVDAVRDCKMNDYVATFGPLPDTLR